ncbi:hypothetical protein LWI29_011610 [Acer saccharum]|uniref:Uncharacterized protein n=1 Tax=Acer saccharum TaxID=4024 RepID=A0AA39SFY6_ACESA|nr:hypothetical protein LWI29_011610 [Acer saccharum]
MPQVGQKTEEARLTYEWMAKDLSSQSITLEALSKEAKLELEVPLSQGPMLLLNGSDPKSTPSLLTEGGDEAREYEWLLVYLYAPQLKNLPLDQETNVDQLIMKNAMKDQWLH